MWDATCTHLTLTDASLPLLFFDFPLGNSAWNHGTFSLPCGHDQLAWESPEDGYEVEIQLENENKKELFLVFLHIQLLILHSHNLPFWDSHKEFFKECRILIYWWPLIGNWLFNTVCLKKEWAYNFSLLFPPSQLTSYIGEREEISIYFLKNSFKEWWKEKKLSWKKREGKSEYLRNLIFLVLFNSVHVRCL